MPASMRRIGRSFIATALCAPLCISYLPIGLYDGGWLLDFCARKNILPDCKMIRMNQVNEAFDQLEHARDIDYRFFSRQAART